MCTYLYQLNVENPFKGFGSLSLLKRNTAHFVQYVINIHEKIMTTSFTCVFRQNKRLGKKNPSLLKDTLKDFP